MNHSRKIEKTKPTNDSNDNRLQKHTPMMKHTRRVTF